MTPEQIAARRQGALNRALEWAHTVQRQIVRLHEAEAQVEASNEQLRRERRHTHDHNRPFFDLRAQKHFLLTAARQLARALEVYGDHKTVPNPRHDAAVMVKLRNALEHWDGRAPALLARHTAAPASAHQWGAGGTVLGGVIRVDELHVWAQEIEEYLLQVSAKRWPGA
jgi:hypothetical protein